MKEILSRGGFNNVIEMDADLSHDPNEIPNNLRMFEDKKIDLLILTLRKKTKQYLLIVKVTQLYLMLVGVL